MLTAMQSTASLGTKWRRDRSDRFFTLGKPNFVALKCLCAAATALFIEFAFFCIFALWLFWERNKTVDFAWLREIRFTLWPQIVWSLTFAECILFGRWKAIHSRRWCWIAKNFVGQKMNVVPMTSITLIPSNAHNRFVSLCSSLVHVSFSQRYI